MLHSLYFAIQALHDNFLTTPQNTKDHVCWLFNMTTLDWFSLINTWCLALTPPKTSKRGTVIYDNVLITYTCGNLRWPGIVVYVACTCELICQKHNNVKTAMRTCISVIQYLLANNPPSEYPTRSVVHYVCKTWCKSHYNKKISLTYSQLHLHKPVKQNSTINIQNDVYCYVLQMSETLAKGVSSGG